MYRLVFHLVGEEKGYPGIWLNLDLGRDRQRIFHLHLFSELVRSGMIARDLCRDYAIPY
jgi:hypothetical protein